MPDPRTSGERSGLDHALERTSNERRDAEARALAAEARAALLEARVNSLEGEPIEWPDDVPRVHSPERVAALVDEALEDLGFAGTAELDCGEFPCVVQLPDAVGGGGYPKVLARLREAGFAESKEVAKQYVVHRKSADGGPVQQTAYVFAYVPDSHANDEVLARVENRLEAYKDAVIHETEEQALLQGSDL